MRVLGKIVLGIINFIVIILSLAFIVIESRLIFSLDFIIYDGIFNGFLRYFLKLLLAIYAFTIAVLLYVNMIIKKEKIKLLLQGGVLSLVIMSIVLFFTTTNYVGLICLVLSVIYAINFNVLLKFL